MGVEYGRLAEPVREVLDSALSEKLSSLDAESFANCMFG